MTIIEAGTTIPQKTQLQPFQYHFTSISGACRLEIKRSFRTKRSNFVPYWATCLQSEIFIIYTLGKYKFYSFLSEWPTKREELAELRLEVSTKRNRVPKNQMIQIQTGERKCSWFQWCFLRNYGIGSKELEKLISTFIMDNKLMSLLILIAILCGFFFICPCFSAFFIAPFSCCSKCFKFFFATNKAQSY